LVVIMVMGFLAFLVDLRMLWKADRRRRPVQACEGER
jgi:hypothetical protein